MRERIDALFRGRPWWMTAIMLFCGFMAFVYLPWDIVLKPIERDQEVWFGFVLTGWAAKATAPLHWIIYAAGFFGFLRMRAWLHPWAAVYMAQIALGMLIWNLRDERGVGPALGIASALPFVALAWALWRARDRFGVRLV